MTQEKKIYFQMMGLFDYHGEEKNRESDALIRGKKSLSFLQYLIVNHTGSITYDALIDCFWGEGKSADPAGVLRYTMSRTRQQLAKIFPEYENLLLTVSNGYVWNPVVELILDSEQFEKMYMYAKHLEQEKQADAFLEAISLYRDDFLADNNDEWVLPLRAYYRTLYQDACKTVLPILEMQERWVDIVQICESAYRRDFSIEEVTEYLMKAYIAMGQPRLAIDHYQAFAETLKREYAIEPSDQVMQIYVRAMGSKKGELGKEDVLSLVLDHQKQKKAYKCSFSTFQSITEIEIRNQERTGMESCITMIRILRSPSMTTDVRRLERVLLEGLRTGDPVAKLNQTSYVALLSGADEKNARMVAERLKAKFTKLYSHSQALIDYQVCLLSPKHQQDGEDKR